MSIASERLELAAALRGLEHWERFARILVGRLERIRPLPAGSRVLEIGAAQGLLLAGFSKLGLLATGVEPWGGAREIARTVQQKTGESFWMVGAEGERLPFISESFDAVVAASVMEHVADVDAVVREAYRVLLPGGVFYFSCASALCPVQYEIRGFPFFGWYPAALKQRLTRWAMVHQPSRVGYTQFPAVNWMTPWRARRMLRSVGFREVLDRWQIRRVDEGGALHRLALTAARSNAVTRIFADVVVPSSGYAAVK